MRCLVFTLALTFAGCATYSQIGSDDSRDASGLSGPGMTVTWLDSRGGYPSVGYYDVQTVFSTKELGSGPYVRVAALHITGTSPKDLLGMLRMQASRIGANRVLIVKAEEKKEEVYLYSELENVAGFFSGEQTAADRRDEAYTLRIEAIAIRMTDDRTTLEPSRQWNDRPTVYQPRRPYDRPTVYRPRRPDDRRNVKPPPPREEPAPVKPPPPKDDPPTEKPPPPKDDQPAKKPPPPKDDRPNMKPPGLKTKTHRP